MTQLLLELFSSKFKHIRFSRLYLIIILFIIFWQHNIFYVILIHKNILNKKGKLTDQEYNIIKKHPQWGYKTLVKSNSLKHIAKYVHYHHEKWDGSGYPEEKKENNIPLISQMISLADSWDAMCSTRPYRNSLSRVEAINEVKLNKGKQFAPDIVDAFLQIENQEPIPSNI